MIGPDEIALRDAFAAAFEAETELREVIARALVAAIGEGETAALLREVANELDGGE